MRRRRESLPHAEGVRSWWCDRPRDGFTAYCVQKFEDERQSSGVYLLPALLQFGATIDNDRVTPKRDEDAA